MRAIQLQTEIDMVLDPEKNGIEGEPTGIQIGNPDQEVTRAVFCWSPTVAVIEKAVELDAQAIVAHEIPYIPGKGSLGLPKDHPPIPANAKRQELYEKHDLVMMQYHAPLDRWSLWNVGRALAAALGFDPEQADYARVDVPVIDLTPQTAREFGNHICTSLNMTGIGISGDLDREIHRVAMFCGGFGRRWRTSELARVKGADAMIVGEVLDYTARAAIEADITVFQASHYTTEDPGVIKWAEHMKGLLSNKIDIVHVPAGESVHYYGSSNASSV